MALALVAAPPSFGNPDRQDLNSLPQRKGYHVTYRLDEANRCPGCGRGHWYVGRDVAECAFCQTALPIERHGGVNG